ncbi:MAG: hypothetical protein WB622_18415 [Acidobacteriaceae bacterium]
MAQAFILTVALAVFWIACVTTVHPHELIVGAAAVVLSVSSCLFVIGTLPLQFRPTLRDIAQIWRLPGYVVIDLIQITVVLIFDLAGRRAPSLFRSAPWGPVENNGRDTAKRALAVSFTTVSPNCIVVGIDCGRSQILLHQLKKSPLPKMTRNLGAGGER